MDTKVEDVAFLARSSHRVDVLDALSEAARDRAALRAETGASSPTMGRILTAFERRQWVVRDGHTYRLTPLGEYVAEKFLRLCDAMETERKLRDVWQWLPREMDGFTVDLFTDAVVSVPGPGYPYEPIERLTHLIEGTDRLRGFDSILYKSANNEAVYQAVLRGMELEYVYSPTALEAAFAWDPERVMEAVTHENCTVFVHDALPDGGRCGLGIVDDRVGICCHDAETGALTAVVDTGAPDAREWAVSVFERYRRDAEQVEPDEVGGSPPRTAPHQAGSGQQ